MLRPATGRRDRDEGRCRRGRPRPVREATSPRGRAQRGGGEGGNDGSGGGDGRSGGGGGGGSSAREGVDAGALAELLLRGDQAELARRLTGAARAVGVTDIWVRTQRGWYTQRIQQEMGSGT